MLRISGKEVAFSRSFLLAAGEEAVVSGVELAGGTLRVTTFEYDHSLGGDQGTGTSFDGSVATMRLPFMKQGSFATNVEFGLNGGTGKLTARVAGQGVGGHLLVQLDIYLERGISFAQR